jgi:hypothetical protein
METGLLMPSRQERGALRKLSEKRPDQARPGSNAGKGRVRSEGRSTEDLGGGGEPDSRAMRLNQIDLEAEHL